MMQVVQSVRKGYGEDEEHGEDVGIEDKEVFGVCKQSERRKEVICWITIHSFQ